MTEHREEGAGQRGSRLLCVGNGAAVSRDGRIWTDRLTAAFLAELGSEVRELCFCAWLDPNDDPLANSALDPALGIRSVVLPRLVGRVISRVKNAFVASVELFREVLRADIVYLFWPGRLSSVTARMCRTIGKPYGIYFRGEQIPPDPTFPRAFSRAAFVLATGPALEKIAKKHCRDVELVTPMVTLSTADLRVTWEPRKPGPWRLLFIGRVEDRKGIFDLVRALAIVLESGFEAELTVVGHCHEPATLRARIPDAAISHIELVGALPDFDSVKARYESADIFILPSHDEGFPRVLYEAMAFGVPIVTTFVGSIPTIMSDERDCLRIDVANPRDIAAKVCRLLSDEVLMRRVAIAGTARVRALMGRWRRSHATQLLERLRP